MSLGESGSVVMAQVNSLQASAEHPERVKGVV